MSDFRCRGSLQIEFIPFDVTVFELIISIYKLVIHDIASIVI